MKNKITIYSGTFEDKEKFEFFNFTKLDHIQDEDGRSYIRLEFEGRFYYFLTVETSISEIEIF